MQRCIPISVRAAGKRAAKYKVKVRGLVIPGQKERFELAQKEQTHIESIVNRLVGHDLLRVYYIIFGKECRSKAKKYQGGTLLQEIDVLEEKWTTRGLSGFMLDRIKDALNVPIPLHCFILDESFVDGWDVLCQV